MEKELSLKSNFANEKSLFNSSLTSDRPKLQGGHTRFRDRHKP